MSWRFKIFKIKALLKYLYLNVFEVFSFRKNLSFRCYLNIYIIAVAFEPAWMFVEISPGRNYASGFDILFNNNTTNFPETLLPIRM